MLAAVSTEHKIGMLVVAGIFIVFALASSFLFPRYWPQFPGSGGRSAFIVASVALTIAMLLAVEFFAVEEEEAEAGDHAAAIEETQTATTETTPTTTETTGATTTTAPEETTTTAARPQTVDVSGTEFAFALTPDDVHPGVVVFRLKNDGQIGHDLKVEGPGVDDAKTPVIEAGQTAELEVELQDGDYELYCTVPGHREGGMEVDLKVG